MAPAIAEETRGVTDKEIVIGTYTDLSGVTAMWGVNNTNAWRMVSILKPSTLISICTPQIPSRVPVTLKSISPK